jgi:hypothetical protein
MLTLLLIIVITFTSSAPLERLNYMTGQLVTYKLDLDLPVRDRYKQVMIDFKDKIKTIAKVTSYIPAYAVMSKIGIYTVKYQEDDWIEYVLMISEYADISISESVMLSTTYELGCTSVLVRDLEGNIILGRNLDFMTYFVFSHGMYEAEYYRKGELVYKGIELAGFKGAINAVKPGKFTASLNQRKYHYLAVNMFRISKGFRSPNYNLMKVMEDAETYEDAIRIMSETPLTAAVYYTIAGLNQGAIITRDNTSVYSITQLEGGKWFLVITNSDLDKPEDDRRKPTEDKFYSLGRENVNYNSVFKIMSEYPTNNLVTMYTSIQTPAGYFNTTTWLP